MVSLLRRAFEVVGRRGGRRGGGAPRCHQTASRAPRRRTEKVSGSVNMGFGILLDPSASENSSLFSCSFLFSSTGSLSSGHLVRLASARCVSAR